MAPAKAVAGPEPEPSEHMSTSSVRALPWYLLAITVVALDQATKLAAEAALQGRSPLAVTGFFDLRLAYNPGAAFSFLADAGGWQRWFFTTLALLVSIVLVLWLARIPRDQRLLPLSLSLVLGGAVGNLVDRIAYGHVIDFLDFHLGNWHWPAFNIADSAICAGAVLLVVQTLFFDREEKAP